MPLRYRIRIQDHLSHDSYRPVALPELARQMRVSEEELEAFQGSLEAMIADGRLELGRDQRYRLPDFPDELEGVLRVNPRGFGFVRSEIAYRRGSLFMPPGSFGDAVSGDRVRVQVVRTRRRDAKDGPTGRVLEVLERGQSEFVGTLEKRGRQWVVLPDGRVLREPVVIRDPHAKNASAGDKVVFEVLHYPDDEFAAEGVIVRVLGEAGRPDVETAAVIASHALRTEFPEEVMQDAIDAARRFDDESTGPWDDREDLTEHFIFTIDPPDAKDFDDAISIVHDEESGSWTLGVHIADVSHFVAPGSAIDVEGRERGNSAYLPRLTLPMLPEALSNGVCSLQEGVNRFAKTAYIEFDRRGRVLGQSLHSTVIRSAKRLTYLEAQALIDGNEREARKHARTQPNYSPELIETLRRADELARVLRKRRQDEGLISLNLPEVELVFDDEGHVIDAQPEDDAFTHTIIEMFMVEANEALARVFADLDVPLIRRIHPDPVHGDIEELRTFARLANFRLPDEPGRNDVQALLNATRDTPAARAIHFAVLRTLSKAVYSPALIGHYALASEHYTHFTSPIRRYPDLTVHRAMQAYLDQTENGRAVPGGRKRRQLAVRLADDSRVLDEADLIELGRHCSDTESAAEDAERELRTFLVLQLLEEKHLGDEFEAIVTGFSGAGVFVSLERFLVDGMVRTQDLPSSGSRADRWERNESTGTMVAQRSGAVIGLGDRIRVRIAAINLAERRMDLVIIELATREEPAGGTVVRDIVGRKERSGGGRRPTRTTGKDGKRKGYKQGRRGRRGR